MSGSIKLSQAVALYIAAILGSGVLFLSSRTATVAGPASLLAWLTVILISFPLAYTFAAMSRTWPDAGGATTFVRMAFGDHAGNLVGWFYFLTATVGQIIVSLTGASYVGIAFHLSDGMVAGLACLILIIGGLSNHFGVQVSGKLSLILSTLLLSMLLLAVLVSLPLVRWEHFVPFTPRGWLPIGTAVTMIFWSFFGWEAICNLSHRFRNPKKDSVQSAMISAVVIGTVFLLLSLITIGTGTYGNTESDTSPVGIMIDRSLGVGAHGVTAMFALIICTGTVNAFVASLAQLGYALSRDRAFPSWFYDHNPYTKTPTRVVWFVVAFAGIGVLLTTLLGIHFTRLLLIPNSLGMIVYLVSMAAACKLYKKNDAPWISGCLSLISLGLFIPFLGLHILVPTVVGGVYFVYIKTRPPRDSRFEKRRQRHGDIRGSPVAGGGSE